MPPLSPTSQGLKVTIRYPGGRSEVLVVDSDRVLVGSGAHCEIRLPPELAQVEHVELTLTGESVHATARALEPLPTINGSGFIQTPVVTGSVLGVGGAELWVEPAIIEENPNVIRKKAQPTSPLAYLGAALMIPLAAYILLMDDTPETAPPAPTAAPVLWDAPAATCPVGSPDQALALALEKRVVAGGKRERRPFHVQDGVAAVPLYETAGACFRLANDAAAAQNAASAASDLRAKIEEDYRAHQVRLEHALNVDDLVTAQKEVTVLRAFTEGKTGPYVQWLSNLDRRLQLKLGRKDGEIVKSYALAALVLVATACASSTPADRAKEDIAQIRAERTPEKLADRGLAFANVGDLTRAEQYLAAALDAGADPAAVLPPLLKVCVLARRYRVAIDYASPQLRRHPSDTHLRYLLASLRASVGDAPGARDDLAKVVELEPKNPDMHFAYATLLRDQCGDPEAADGEFRAYLALAPTGEHAEEARGSLLRKVGPGEGDPSVNRALKSVP